MSTQKSTYWSVTINNPNEADDENVQQALQRGWKVEGQKEKGENGTIHYQIALRTPNQQRFSAVKKAFPRAHIEIARNPIALKQYVQKEETREGELPDNSEYYPSLSKLWDLIYEYGNDNCIWDIGELPHNVVVFPKHWEIQYQLKNDPLAWFDSVINALIQEGYHVESFASNPQNRFAWKTYYKSLLIRSALKKQKEYEANKQNASPPMETESSDEETEIQNAQIPIEEDYLND